MMDMDRMFKELAKDGVMVKLVRDGKVVARANYDMVW